jgi:hypothetical protein
MNLLKSRIGFALALAVGMLASGIATATPITMDFDGLTPGTSVHNYYDGGCSKGGFLDLQNIDCGGPDYGVKWRNAHIRALGDEPSAPNWAGPGLFSNGTMTMNVADGFGTGLTFYYSTFAKFLSGTITIYDGTNGQGSVLTSLDLAGTGIYCSHQIPCWLEFGLDFIGLAKSVVFAGPGSAAFGLDDVTIGANLTAAPVPEPATFGVFGLGLLLIGAFVGLRRRSYQS